MLFKGPIEGIVHIWILRQDLSSKNLNHNIEMTRLSSDLKQTLTSYVDEKCTSMTQIINRFKTNWGLKVADLKHQSRVHDQKIIDILRKIEEIGIKTTDNIIFRC